MPRGFPVALDTTSIVLILDLAFSTIASSFLTSFSISFLRSSSVVLAREILSFISCSAESISSSVKPIICSNSLILLPLLRMASTSSTIINEYLCFLRSSVYLCINIDVVNNISKSPLLILCKYSSLIFLDILE